MSNRSEIAQNRSNEATKNVENKQERNEEYGAKFTHKIKQK